MGGNVEHARPFDRRDELAAVRAELAEAKSKLAMHGELVALLTKVMHSQPYSWIKRRDAILARAAQLENGGESDE